MLLADGISSKAFEGALAPFPSAEKLSYDIEWRLIYAGSALLSLAPKPGDPRKWDSQLRVESGGLVSKLYTLQDTYNVGMDEGFCTTSTQLDAIEGKRHRNTKVVYDHARGKANSVERDLNKNAVIKSSEVEIPACAMDVVAGLYKLRMDKLEPGQSKQVPMSDGKKTAYVRVEAQGREQVKIKAGTFETIRYEVFVFNGVLYSRKARSVRMADGRRAPLAGADPGAHEFPGGDDHVRVDQGRASVASLYHTAVQTLMTRIVQLDRKNRIVPCRIGVASDA